MTNSLEALFWHVDDFCQIFEPKWRQLLLGNGLQQRQRARCLSMSEVMAIPIAFHQNHYRDFKHFYQKQVCKYWQKEFPKLPSYNRFVEYMGSAMMPLCIYLKHCFAQVYVWQSVCRSWSCIPVVSLSSVPRFWS